MLSSDLFLMHLALFLAWKRAMRWTNKPSLFVPKNEDENGNQEILMDQVFYNDANGENTSIWFWPFRPLLLIWTLSTLTFSTSLINLDSFNFDLFDLSKFSLRMTSVQITRYFHFYALIVGLMVMGCWIWNKLIVSDKGRCQKK